mmetsp:Transcript_33101/g.97483  ORF Transcript_33101/g.97483 Transcript_33101/m.97483 type:complete len:274 (-) Transcript_33101:545-1366(-)
MALLKEIRETLQEAEASFDGSVRSALETDESAFKMGRFKPFVNAVVARVEAQKFKPAAVQQPLDELLSEAANVTSEWVEACKSERLDMRERANKVAPVKAKALELLELSSKAALPKLAMLEKVDLKACVVEGPGVKSAHVGGEAKFTVKAQSVEGLPLSATLRGSGGRPVVATDRGRQRRRRIYGNIYGAQGRHCTGGGRDVVARGRTSRLCRGREPSCCQRERHRGGRLLRSRRVDRRGKGLLALHDQRRQLEPQAGRGHASLHARLARVAA